MIDVVVSYMKDGVSLLMIVVGTADVVVAAVAVVVFDFPLFAKAQQTIASPPP